MARQPVSPEQGMMCCRPVAQVGWWQGQIGTGAPVGRSWRHHYLLDPITPPGNARILKLVILYVSLAH